ncbi:hypothetical protein HAX54_014084 [Datura stramonium]|uniref:Uncharacterized protein n=1 Tax=Datura stramonium TaxID=4076 RepID=A0ABS8TMH9_DATST|nr:hypothetical protein [Datura stramonium]
MEASTNTIKGNYKEALHKSKWSQKTVKTLKKDQILVSSSSVVDNDLLRDVWWVDSAEEKRQQHEMKSGVGRNRLGRALQTFRQKSTVDREVCDATAKHRVNLHIIIGKDGEEKKDTGFDVYKEKDTLIEGEHVDKGKEAHRNLMDDRFFLKVPTVNLNENNPMGFSNKKPNVFTEPFIEQQTELDTTPFEHPILEGDLAACMRMEGDFKSS